MLNDSESMRRSRADLGEDAVPVESAILRFWLLLQQHQLTVRMFDAVETRLTEQ